MNVRDLVWGGRPLFELGVMLKTRDVDRFLKDAELFDVLIRHQYGDWSEMADDDRRANEWAVKENLRIFSSYIVRDEKVWIITEADRSLTTVLFSHEY